LDVATKPQDITAENILQRLSDLTTHPHEEIVPYREFNVDGKLYYFTPGGFLYRKDPATGALGASSAAISPMRSGTTEPTRSRS
jgi:hypothetical protein